MNDAGVNNLYAISNTTDEVKKALSNDFRMIENWFHENVMVLNAKKKKKDTITCISETAVKMSLYSTE